MLGMVKVYNKGKKPLVWQRSHKGTYVIHPGKFDTFGQDKADEIIKKFPNAVSEEDFLKLQAAAAKKEQSTAEDK